MMIEFSDEEARLLRAVLLEKAREYFSYANPSEAGERLCKLAVRLVTPSRELETVNNSYVEVRVRGRIKTILE